MQVAILQSMRLYATLTSNRATKGQGGDRLDIQLQGENGQGLGVIAIRYIEDTKNYIGMFYCGHDQNQSKNIFVLKEKGKK